MAQSMDVCNILIVYKNGHFSWNTVYWIIVILIIKALIIMIMIIIMIIMINAIDRMTASDVIMIRTVL